jgi:hypothetical protein
MIEELVAKYGEYYRVLITDSLAWLEEHEGNWGLSEPIDKKDFVFDIISHTRREP